MSKATTNSIDNYLSEHNRLLISEGPEHCMHICTREFGSGFYFRGMGNARYDILSSMDRAHAMATHFKYCGDKACKFREQWYFREFKKLAHNHLSTSSLPNTHLEWLAVMQHYGVPTRLVDLTKSPFIALYFAVRNWQSETDAVVWAIGHEKLHLSSFHRLLNNNFPLPMNSPEDYSHDMQEFLADSYFLEAFISDKYDVAMILNPQWASDRLSAQQGAFLITSVSNENKLETIFNLVNDDSYMDAEEKRFLKDHKIDISIRKLLIPAKQKKRIFQQLHRMNISAGTLFPGLSGAAEGVTEIGTVEDWESVID